jgi:hypothetical protein
MHSRLPSARATERGRFPASKVTRQTRPQRVAGAVARSMDDLLRAIGEPGSYVAESDFFEPQWRRSFWAFACVLHPKFLDDLVERHRGECYENILSFSTLVGLIRDALVLRFWGQNVNPTPARRQTDGRRAD